MIFHRPSLADKQWIKEIFSHASDLSCEYTFGNIYAYQAKLDIHVARVGDCLITRCAVDNFTEYCYPVGTDVKKALDAIIEDAKLLSLDKVNLFGLNPSDATALPLLYPGKFDIHENRDGGDYIYLAKDLATLDGKKYQPKRNHISYFTRNNNWTYEEINRDNIAECLEMSHEWLNLCSPDLYEDLVSEEKCIIRAFDAFDELDFRGGLLRVDGRVVAYTMGEAIDNDTFCVHYEKAFSHVRGAYPMINKEFVKNTLTDFTYINREDDLGIENLRKAKLSYHPYRIYEKYDAFMELGE